jgi:hypothetical protein
VPGGSLPLQHPKDPSVGKSEPISMLGGGLLFDAGSVGNGMELALLEGESVIVSSGSDVC